MISPIFVDTSALIAMGNKRDSYHIKAVRIDKDNRKNNSRYVTTSAVLLELGNSFSQRQMRATATRIIRAIQESQAWHVVQIDEEIFNQSLQLFTSMNDKEWGLVDCTSIIVANKFKLTKIFTTDHHFEQAGFSILLST
jgi:predicted nucleic acid-binding protein